MSEEFYNDEIYIDWTTWERIRDERMALVIKQLRIEVGPTHKLFDLLDTIEFRAADDASDSVLAVDPENNEVALVIHPTFSKTVQTDSSYPLTYTIPLASVPKRFL